ncbi:MAG: hypothetical protein IJ930_01225 [Lachnospiraceae bacterium]|nr:hypothetical protein [Lachnospiraceae bacterium]
MDDLNRQQESPTVDEVVKAVQNILTEKEKAAKEAAAKAAEEAAAKAAEEAAAKEAAALTAVDSAADTAAGSVEAEAAAADIAKDAVNTAEKAVGSVSETAAAKTSAGPAKKSGKKAGKKAAGSAEKTTSRPSDSIPGDTLVADTASISESGLDEGIGIASTVGKKNEFRMFDLAGETEENHSSAMDEMIGAAAVGGMAAPDDMTMSQEEIDSFIEEQTDVSDYADTPELREIKRQDIRGKRKRQLLLYRILGIAAAAAVVGGVYGVVRMNRYYAPDSEIAAESTAEVQTAGEEENQPAKEAVTPGMDTETDKVQQSGSAETPETAESAESVSAPTASSGNDDNNDETAAAPDNETESQAAEVSPAAAAEESPAGTSSSAAQTPASQSPAAQTPAASSGQQTQTSPAQTAQAPATQTQPAQSQSSQTPAAQSQTPAASSGQQTQTSPAQTAQAPAAQTQPAQSQSSQTPAAQSQTPSASSGQQTQTSPAQTAQAPAAQSAPSQTAQAPAAQSAPSQTAQAPAASAPAAQSQTPAASSGQQTQTRPAAGSASQSTAPSSGTQGSTSQTGTASQTASPAASTPAASSGQQAQTTPAQTAQAPAAQSQPAQSPAAQTPAASSGRQTQTTPAQTAQAPAAQSAPAQTAQAPAASAPAAQTAPAQSQTQASPATGAAPGNIAALAPYRDTLPYGSVYDASTTAVLGNEVGSTFAILVNADTNQVVAWKNGANYMNPASMSKIMTILIASEMADPDTVCTVPQSVVNYCRMTGISSAGFSAGEKVTVRDLMYATMLSSGADAAMTLAASIGGSEAGFAQLMNNKLNELGLSSTAHFNNSVGLYQPGHFCTVYDIAVIMEAALSDPVCRDVLTAQTYTTAATAQHPSGIALKNSFLEQTRAKTSGSAGVLLSARSGYVKQSGCCAVTAFQAPDGQLYVCVTGDTTTQDNAGLDHAYIYKNYVK